MGLYDTRALYSYLSDYTAQGVYVGLNSQRAAAGGFSSAPSDVLANKPTTMHMRRVVGFDPLTGRTMSLPIADPTNPMYTGITGTFTVNGVTYTVSSAYAEDWTGRT